MTLACVTHSYVSPEEALIPMTERSNWAMACDFQQYGILTCVDLDEPLQPPFKLKTPRWCSVSWLTIKEYSSD